MPTLPTPTFATLLRRARRAVAAGVRARALAAAGRLALWQGDAALAGSRLEAAAALGSAAGDLRTAAIALNNLGIIAEQQGDLERAAAFFEEALALYRQGGDRRGIAICLLNLGGLAQRRGALAQAEAWGAKGWRCPRR